MSTSDLCDGCSTGRHTSHDTWGPKAPEVFHGKARIGDDAGCPNLNPQGRECACQHVNPPSRTHRPGKHCPTCQCKEANHAK